MSKLTTSTEAARPISTEWQLEFARLIAFPVESALGLTQSWWRDLVNDLPDDYTLIRRKDIQEERGTAQRVGLSLIIDRHRIEWLIEPLGTLDESDGRLPTIGPFRDTISWFTPLMTGWLDKSSPPLLRLAFAGKLLQPADSQEEVYQVLERRLPGVKLMPRPNDFLYHVNRRRNSRIVNGLPVNRMSTWSKLNVLFSASLGTPFSWPEKGYSAVQLDINTAPETGEALPTEALPNLFEELVALGIEIAERGDIE